MELARGLEPLTCCLQDSCATDCATPARRLFPLVGGPQPLRMKSTSRVHLLMSVHSVRNQVRGTIHGLLSDGTDQGSVHVAGDRDARMPEELGHTALSAPEANIKLAAVIFDRPRNHERMLRIAPQCLEQNSATWGDCRRRPGECDSAVHRGSNVGERECRTGEAADGWSPTELRRSLSSLVWPGLCQQQLRPGWIPLECG
jgi:hypothetical protein